MKIYLCRHGEAGFGYPDDLRELTENGIQQVHQLAKLLNKKKPGIQKVFHSGLIRAKQTSELLAAELGLASPIQTENLRPEDDVKIWGKKLWQQQQEVLLVGHLPFMAIMTEFLSGPAPSVTFRTANLVCIDLNPKGEGKVLYHLCPY